MARASGVDFQFLTKVTHIYAQIVTMFHRVGSPHLTQQLALGENLAVVIKQHGEQAEFDGGKMDFLFTAHNAPCGEVNPNITKRVGRVAGVVAL